MNSTANLGFAILAAHLLEKFVLQRDRVGDLEERPAAVAFRAARRAALAYLVAGQWAGWPVPVAVFCIQGLIDCVRPQVVRSDVRMFLGTQAAHLGAIVLIAAHFGGGGDSGFWAIRFGPAFPRALAVGCGAIVCIRAAAVLVGFWVQPYLDEIRRSRPSEPLPDSRGLTNGGRVIGQWERGLIFLFVLIGQPGAIGFLIAAKSVFRFGELNDRHNRMEAEYITIGTLMSFGLAVAVAELTRWIASGM